jgi:O-antigen/teichoic acid export membrane protein
MVVNSGPEPTTGLPVTRNIRGLHAGLIVLIGIAALNIGNYVFHVIAARRLGPSRYSDLAALITLSGLVSLPLGGVQIWVARHVAQYRAADDADAIRWFARRVGANLLTVGVVATALFLIASWPLQRALGIGSFPAVVLLALTVFPAVVTPLPWGIAQGLERFGTVALAYAIGPVMRLAFVIVAFAAGARVGGAMLATLASMIAALALPTVAVRKWLRRPRDLRRRIPRGDAVRSLLPVMAGLLAITALTSADVIVAKLALPSHQAGIYGTASLVGRVILYLPAAIVTVLLPRVAARVADNRETSDLLGQSVAVTIAFSIVGTCIYAAAGTQIARVAFGAQYSQAAGLLWLFGVAMGFYAVLNVLLIYHLAREHNRMVWLLLGGAGVQMLVFLVHHSSPRELVFVDMVVGAALLVAHEVVLDLALSRSLVALVRR